MKAMALSVLVSLSLVSAAPPSRPDALLQPAAQLAADEYTVVKAARDARLFRAMELSNGMRLVLEGVHHLLYCR